MSIVDLNRIICHLDKIVTTDAELFYESFRVKLS